MVVEADPFADRAGGVMDSIETDLPPGGPSFITRVRPKVLCSPGLDRRDLEFRGLITGAGWLRHRECAG